MTYSSTFDEDDFKLRKNCPDMRSRIVEMVDDICRDPYSSGDGKFGNAKTGS